MAISIRQDFHTDLASVVADDIQTNQSNYFYFLGKVDSWSGSDVVPSLPETNSIAEDTTIRANAMFMRRIVAGDISLVTQRYTWTSGQTYVAWDHTRNMEMFAYYVVTSQNNVYKCLSNNGDSPSTVMPTGNSFGVTTTADGYIWKFMYSIPSYKVSKFMTASFIPVQKALSDSFYSKGAIDSVSIINGGTGYPAGIQTTVSVSGTTTGSGATAHVTVGASGVITDVIIDTGGSGYTLGATMTISGSGTGAVLTPVIVAGEVTGTTIVSGGVGYVNGEAVVITVGGAKVIPAVNSSGTITSLILADSGVGYTGSVTLTVNTPSTGSGLYGNPSALLSGIVHDGKLKHVNIIDPGQNYPYATATTISIVGDGTGAELIPVIDDGEIVSVIVENQGQDYTYANLIAVGSGGSGAVLRIQQTGSDFASNQSLVEQTTSPGAIYYINVTNGGNNYSNTTTVEIVGDGTGAVAVPTIVSGVITKFTMTSFGSGYTYANLVVEDPNRSLIGSVVDVEAHVCLPPINGHGFDAVDELNGNTLAINTSLRQETNLNSLLQDYRQFGIIKDPLTLYTNRTFTGASEVVAYRTQFGSVTDLVVDETLVLNGARFRVVGIEGNEVILQSLGTKLIVPTGTLVAESNNNRTYNSFRVITSPTINKYSGKLLYTSSENPFSFTEEQGVVIKTFLKF